MNSRRLMCILNLECVIVCWSKTMKVHAGKMYGELMQSSFRTSALHHYQPSSRPYVSMMRSRLRVSSHTQLAIKCHNIHNYYQRHPPPVTGAVCRSVTKLLPWADTSSVECWWVFSSCNAYKNISCWHIRRMLWISILSSHMNPKLLPPSTKKKAHRELLWYDRFQSEGCWYLQKITWRFYLSQKKRRNRLAKFYLHSEFMTPRKQICGLE